MGGYPAEEELLHQMARGSAAETFQDVMKEPQPGSRAGGIVQGRDLAGRQIAQNIGIVGLPVTVVALANESCGDGMERSRPDAAGTLVEVARVLVKDRLRQHMANDDAVNVVGILGSKTLRIAFHSLAELAVSVPRLLDSRGDPSVQEYNRIENGFPTELKLLRGSQGSRIRFIADEEVRKHAEQTLLLLTFHLLHGQFFWRESHIHGRGHGSHLQDCGQ